VNPQQTFCPHQECPARGQLNQGNIVIDSQQEQRYRCKVCGKTCSARQGSVFFRSRVGSDIITLVLTLLAYGCPMPALEAAGHPLGRLPSTHGAALDASGGRAL
jgi:transposase-like protein